MILDGKTYNSALFMDELQTAGVNPEDVIVRGGGEQLIITILADDPGGTIAQTINDVAAAHDGSQVSESERIEQSREQIVNHFDLDAEDRVFIRDLSQVFTLAQQNDTGAQQVYDEIRAVVNASDKHRAGVAYWYEKEYGIDLLAGVTLTVQNKRDFIKCVGRYYARRLAPALTVWLMRGGLDVAPGSE